MTGISLEKPHPKDSILVDDNMNLRLPAVKTASISKPSSGNAFSKFFHRKLSPGELEIKRRGKEAESIKREIERQLKVVPEAERQRYGLQLQRLLLGYEIGRRQTRQITRIIKLVPEIEMPDFVKKIFDVIRADPTALELSTLIHFRKTLSCLSNSDKRYFLASVLNHNPHDGEFRYNVSVTAYVVEHGSGSQLRELLKNKNIASCPEIYRIESNLFDLGQLEVSKAYFPAGKTQTRKKTGADSGLACQEIPFPVESNTVLKDSAD